MKLNDLYDNVNVEVNMIMLKSNLMNEDTSLRNIKQQQQQQP